MSSGKKTNGLLTPRRLRRLRKAGGVTQGELFLRSGVSQQLISAFERRLTPLTPEKKKKILAVLIPLVKKRAEEVTAALA